MGKIKDIILWLFFTNKCTYCGKILSYGESLCKNCKDNLPRIVGERCKFCGVAKERCKCNKHKMRVDGVTAPFYYEKSIVESITRLKFGTKDFVAHRLALDMAQSVIEDFKDISFDYITFVPVTDFQKRHRYYNQSELLAIKLGKELSLPVKDIMLKLFDNNIQHEASQNRRKGNVLGVYDVKDNVDVKNKIILLVDDIKTTGATLNECAKILKIRGAEKVYCVTVALTGKKVVKNLDK